MGETSGLKRLRQHILRAELKKQRTHVRMYTCIDDGKNRRPATSVTLSPHRGHSTSAGFQYAIHLLQRTHGGWHIHQAKGTQSGIERRIRVFDMFGVHTFEGQLGQVLQPSHSPGMSEHLVSNVRPDDAACRADLGCGLQSYQPGATCDVEDAFPGL